MKLIKLVLPVILFITIASCVSKKEFALMEERYSKSKDLLSEYSNRAAELNELNKGLLNKIETLTEQNNQMVQLPVELRLSQNLELLSEENFNEINLNLVKKDTLVSCLSKKPTILSNLNSGSTKFVYTIDENNTNSANLLGLISGKLNENERMAIVDYVEYKDLICENSKKYRVAAGVRLTLKIKSTKNKFKINIPSKVAAASEFGIAEVTYRIETIGFKNSATRRILSNLGGEFNVDDYVKVLNAVNQIQIAMDSVTTVDPRVIPIENF